RRRQRRSRHSEPGSASTWPEQLSRSPADASSGHAAFIFGSKGNLLVCAIALVDSIHLICMGKSHNRGRKLTSLPAWACATNDPFGKFCPRRRLRTWCNQGLRLFIPSVSGNTWETQPVIDHTRLLIYIG